MLTLRTLRARRARRALLWLKQIGRSADPQRRPRGASHRGRVMHALRLRKTAARGDERFAIPARVVALRCDQNTLPKICRRRPSGLPFTREMGHNVTTRI